MDDDLIVVDDEAGPSAPRLISAPEHPVASSSRLRSSSNPPNHVSNDAAERTTRSSASKSKAHPKLKLKLSEKAAAQAPGMSFLGQYDRELDSDDEDLLFEEQFILRMPPGEDLEKLRKMVAAREITNDVWFKFKGIYIL
jgi:transcription initiation factor TFIID subunit 7